MSIGIYKITNKKNNKIYVGSSANLERRYYYHLNSLRKNKHYNIHLQRSFNRDGEESFEYSILEYCNNDVLVDREEYLIEHLNSLDTRYGYNINPNGDRPPSWSGKTHTESTKLKMSKVQKGRICTQYMKNIASLTHKGKKISAEQIEFLREKNKGEGNPMFGRTPYDVWLEKYGKEVADQKQLEWKENHDKNMKKGVNNHMFGKSLYDIWLEKYGKEEADIRYNKWKNKIVTEESKERLRTINIGRKAKDSTRKKMSDGKKGELNGSCKIKDVEIPKILELLNTTSAVNIAKMYNVSKRTIYNIKNGKRKV